MKYAIQIMYEGKPLFITQGTLQQVKTFDSREEAEHASKTWPSAKVVEYRN